MVLYEGGGACSKFVWREALYVCVWKARARMPVVCKRMLISNMSSSFSSCSVDAVTDEFIQVRGET